ncbi:hypothetical protein FQN60_013970 [Etheostoma spectabile]|uniref:Uncharacterized protein n=1 Tax=Etheostoma spectabile TaxID=54343 RepID=A0A5J5CGK9_9PERO|nr:hypothetical protein FQN60_013970 [Etheostoma spectabile]
MVLLGAADEGVFFWRGLLLLSAEGCSAPWRRAASASPSPGTLQPPVLTAASCLQGLWFMGGQCAHRSDHETPSTALFPAQVIWSYLRPVLLQLPAPSYDNIQIPQVVPSTGTLNGTCKDKGRAVRG